MTFMQKGFLASHIKREHSGNMVLEEYECNQCPKVNDVLESSLCDFG